MRVLTPIDHLNGHCLHAHPTPGAFVCCQCTRRSDSFPGLTTEVAFGEPCTPDGRFRVWLRHHHDGWHWRIPVGHGLA